MGDVQDAIEGNKKFWIWVAAVKSRAQDRSGVIGEKLLGLYKELVYVIEGREVGDI